MRWSLFLSVWFLLLATPCRGQDAEQQYLNALRDRRLYKLLESYCRRELGRVSLTPAQEARYTIELSRILAVRADEQPSAKERAKLWDQASGLLSGFLDRNPGHPQSPNLRYQLGVYALARGELHSQQARFGLRATEQQTLAKAIEELRRGATLLRKVEQEVTRLLSNTDPNAEPAPDRLGYRALQNLNAACRFRLGQTLLSLARLSPNNSADRTNYASEANRAFENFTFRFSPSVMIVESHLAKAECLHLLGDDAGARKCLSTLDNDQVDQKYRDQALVLSAKMQFERKGSNLQRTVSLIEELRKLMAPNPELDTLYVEAALTLAGQRRKQGDNLGARNLVSAIIQTLDQIEQDHGKAWIVICEVLLADLAEENLLVEESRVLGRMARGLHRRGEARRAIAVIDRAMKLATTPNDSFNLSYQAATILRQLKDWDGAAERFARLAADFPTHEMSFLCHFKATECVGLSYAAARSPEKLEQYERLLEQHVRQFPEKQTNPAARWLLGSLHLARQQLAQAATVLRGIPPGHERFSVAQGRIAEAYEKILRSSWQRNQDDLRVTSAALDYFRQATRAAPSNAAEVSIRIRYCRLLCHPKLARHAAAQEMLDQILFDSIATEPQRAVARQLNLLSLVGQDKFKEARERIDAEIRNEPAELFAVNQVLDQAADTDSETRRVLIGKLQLVVLEKLAALADSLSKQDRLRVEIGLALALVTAGEPERAEVAFDRLAEKLPGNRRVLRAQAECYMKLGQFSRARATWRKLLAVYPERSEDWFESKYQLAQACFRSGDSKQCIKIIDVTSTFHPDLGGPEMKARFESLRLKAKNGR